MPIRLAETCKTVFALACCSLLVTCGDDSGVASPAGTGGVADGGIGTDSGTGGTGGGAGTGGGGTGAVGGGTSGYAGASGGGGAGAGGSIAGRCAPLADRTAPETVFYQDLNDGVPRVYTSQDFREEWNTANDDEDGRVEIVKDPNQSGRDSVMQISYAGGVILARGAIWSTDLGPHEELYFSYDVMFNQDIEWTPGGKLPGLGGSGTGSDGGCNIPDGTNGWLGRLMWRAEGKLVTYLFTYHWGYFQPGVHCGAKDVDWLDDTGEYAPLFTPGQWHTVEMRYKMNTPGERDGIHQGWFDCRLAVDMDVGYRTVATEKVDKLSFSTFFGGNWAPLKDEKIYFDNFVVSTAPITH